MTYVLYIIGLLIGLVMFLYALSFYESGKDKFKKKFASGDKGRSSNTTINPGEISYEDIKNQTYPRERICPLCGAILTKYEALYAFQQETAMDRKIMIYGCRYCYKPEKES